MRSGKSGSLLRLSSGTSRQWIRRLALDTERGQGKLCVPIDIDLSPFAMVGLTEDGASASELYISRRF